MEIPLSLNDSFRMILSESGHRVIGPSLKREAKAKPDADGADGRGKDRNELLDLPVDHSHGQNLCIKDLRNPASCLAVDFRPAHSLHEVPSGFWFIRVPSATSASGSLFLTVSYRPLHPTFLFSAFFGSTCPPNFCRMADSVFSAKV
jgi:hypothetical protein